MEKTSTQQEILLMTGTSFSSMQLCEKDDADKNKPLSEKELLEEACWQGLMKEMLPELFSQSSNLKQLYLWQITEGGSFLGLDFAEYPLVKDKYYSIDPYIFLKEKYYC